MKKTYIMAGISIVVVLIAVLAALIVFKMYRAQITEKPKLDYQDEQYAWNAVISATKGDLLVRGKKIDEIKDDIEKLVFAVNRSDMDAEAFRTPENKEPDDPPKLKFIEKKMDIAIVEVINSEYLTQRMGTTGADAFMAAATFTLTEHEDIGAVFFTFEQGDHAVPGLYSREMFTANWKVKTNDTSPRGDFSGHTAGAPASTPALLYRTWDETGIRQEAMQVTAFHPER